MMTDNTKAPDGPLVDQAGWHMSDRLVVPPNVTLVPLPPRCPELNAMENVWQFMRDNWLSNRIFRSYEFATSMTDPGGRNLWQDGVVCRQRGRPLSMVHTSPPMSWTRG